MKEVSPIDLKKILNSQLTFSPQTYSTTPNKAEYLFELLTHTMIKHKLDNHLSLDDLHGVLKDLLFDLTLQQLHELYLFCTFDVKNEKLEVREKLKGILTQQKNRLKVELIVEWLMRNMEGVRARQRMPGVRGRREKESEDNQKQKEKIKLPKLTKSSSDKLKNQLEPLIGLFDQMDKLRHKSGLIPMKMEQDEEDQIDIPSMYIPYDPELYDLNLNLSKLRIKAEQQLQRIVQLSRENPRIRQKLETGIQRFQSLRISKNQKVGRNGAINAQRRLAQQRHRQAQKFKNLNLSMNEDLVRAAKVYSLLNTPDPKVKPVF